MANPNPETPWISGGADDPDPNAREYTVTAPDGRTIGVAEYGPEDGTPVFSIHGTPGSRYGGPPPEKPDLYDRLGVRSIGFDRAGYGRSTRKAGRNVADAAADVEAIARHLGVAEFAVVGGSGGGPHCLAVATLLGDRVTRASCVVGVAPYGDHGVPTDEWMVGMTKGNIDEFNWSLAGEATMRPNLERLAAEELPRLEIDPATALGDDYELSEGDREIMSRPAFAQRIKRGSQEAYRNGVDGWVDDNLAFVKPWGFDLKELSVPTMVWFGLHDTLVPASHGEWLAENVNGAKVVRMAGGHMELANRAEDMVTWLIGGDLPEDATSS